MIGEQGGFGLVSLLRGLLGIITILGIAYAMSYDRKRIDWKLVGGGLFMQIVFALAVLYVPFVGSLLEGCGKIFVKLKVIRPVGRQRLHDVKAAVMGDDAVVVQIIRQICDL